MKGVEVTLPLLHPLVGDNSQADADKGLEGDPLEVGEEEGLAEDDLGLGELPLHHSLEAMREHQLQVVSLCQNMAMWS